MLNKGDSLRIIKLYYKTLNSYLNAYLARPVITIKDRLGRLTGIIFLLSKSVKFIITSESRDKDIIVSSQHSWLSTCGGMPWPGKYLFTVHWSGLRFPHMSEKYWLIKMTHINFVSSCYNSLVSRNQLHNTANSCQPLNFGLSWPG